MNFWKSLGGILRIKLICADPASAMMEISNAGITILDAERLDEDITVFFGIYRKDYKRLKELANRRGYELKLTSRNGLYWLLGTLRRRKLLTLGLLFLTVLAMYFPSRVLFVRVEGNENIPARLILEKCGECGISFGASRKEVRSEKVKNALLEAIPELQWAGVNTYGCVAVVSVKERSETQIREELMSVSSLVASRDGIIVSCTVTRGNNLCRVGQVVRTGQTLVSGYTDCGLSIQATRAEGEIYAQTQRQLQAVIPAQWIQKGEIRAVEKKYSLIIGKNRINFYKGSGISGATCDKMYAQYCITLPGGFVLPISVVEEVWTYHDEAQVQRTEEETLQILADFADHYVADQMVAGQILSREESIVPKDGIFCLSGNYACIEMIAQVRNEENYLPYGDYS